MRFPPKGGAEQARCHRRLDRDAPKPRAVSRGSPVRAPTRARRQGSSAHVVSRELVSQLAALVVQNARSSDRIALCTTGEPPESRGRADRTLIDGAYAAIDGP